MTSAACSASSCFETWVWLGLGLGVRVRVRVRVGVRVRVRARVGVSCFETVSASWPVVSEQYSHVLTTAHTLCCCGRSRLTWVGLGFGLGFGFEFGFGFGFGFG